MAKIKNLISVASGKGGVGKTWFSISLAHALAAGGKKVLLVDGDLGLANVDIQLGLTPDRDISTFLNGKCTVFEAIHPYQKGRFDILPGRSGNGSLASLAGPKLERLKQSLYELAPKYDLIILDLGAGVDQIVRGLADLSSSNVVITTDEPTSLTDAYAYIKIRHMDDDKANIQLVVNQAKTREDGEKTYQTLLKACQNFLKFSLPLAGIIKQDQRIPESIRHQMPIFERYPTAEVITTIGQIAKRVSNI